MKELSLRISQELDGLRLDLALLRAFPQFTRSQLKTLGICVYDKQGRPFRLSYHVSSGQVFYLRWEEKSSEVQGTLQPNDIPLRVVYEDLNCLVVDKEVGMVIHPGNGHASGTLVNALLFYVGSLAKAFVDDNLRPGLVHRLDKDTSGLVICAKNTRALEYLSRQFRERKTQKSYLAIVKGKLKSPEGSISSYLTRERKNRHKYCETNATCTGKEALTKWKVLTEWLGSSLVELQPITGRTHQLRVHMKSQGNPILGDVLYSRTAKEYSRLYLHAWGLSIALPSEDSNRQRTFYTEIPQSFLDYFLLQDKNYTTQKWFISLMKRSTSP